MKNKVIAFGICALMLLVVFSSGCIDFGGEEKEEEKDTTPPTISDVQSSSITSSSATITWTICEPGSFVVEYGTSTSYGSTVSGNVTYPFEISRSITLSGLSVGTTYHYRVKSTDSSGNTATSNDYTFTTLSTEQPTTVYVGGTGSGNYTTIQAGIDAASNGSTVFVYSGTYYEHITVTKKINLVGEGKDTTIIDGGNTGTVVIMYGSADYARIANFTIRNGKDSTNTIKYGIRVGSSYTTIENCNIHSNEDGIDICSNNTLIKNCDICSNDYEGIAIWSSYTSIQNCNISYNANSGIDIRGSYNEITYCNIQANVGYGAYNWKETSNGNVIHHNNFIDNWYSPQANDTGTNSWDNGYSSGGNYWDDYTGVDANGDGIGDTAYVIPGGDNQDRYPLMTQVGSEDGSETTSRVVLAELCTATWCGACPYATDALDQLANEYSSTKLAVLEYHPSGSDPFGNADSDARISYYSITGYPTCFFDGVEEVVGGGSSTYDTYKAKIEARLQVSTSLTIMVGGSLGSTSGSVNADITAVTTPTQSNLKIRLVIYEDNISYNAPNGETNHRFVVRDVLSEESLTISSGQSKDVSRTFTIQSGWNKNNLGVVVFVQSNTTKEVLQAGSYNFVPTKNSNTILCFSSNNPLYPQADDISTVTTRLEDIRLLQEENRKII
ncbi:MAG: Omp28-related outer membrane protein [Thermoplasmatales archaeon]|nr:Omp28-related outer membrane protein [Thermoplasmatales archaeon]